MKMKSRQLLFTSLLMLALTSLLGCQSAKQPGSMSHASVQIRGHTPVDIVRITAAVFHEAGYAQASASAAQMVFERPGTRRDAVKWGGWAGTGVTMRVKVGLTSMVNGSVLLTADVFAVQNSDDDFFRTESRVVMANRRPVPEAARQGRRGLEMTFEPHPFPKMHSRSIL